MLGTGVDERKHRRRRISTDKGDGNYRTLYDASEARAVLLVPVDPRKIGDSHRPDGLAEAYELRLRRIRRANDCDVL